MKIMIDFADCEMDTECEVCGADLQWKEDKFNKLTIFPCTHCTEQAFSEGLAKGRKMGKLPC